MKIKNKIQSWKGLKPYLYCLFLAFLFLLVCSKNSLLYRLNDWVDANAFFTVGKGMVRGVVPYRDLFEQKGPLLYFIYGVGSLFSYTTFYGVFLLEVISFSIFLYYVYKSLCLFFSKEKVYWILPLFTLLVVSLKSFTHGGSAEEFALPYLMVSFYSFLLYIKNETSFIPKRYFLHGIMASCVFWIKYTLIGFWFGWMLLVVFSLLIKKSYKEMFQVCGYFLLGFLIASLPWFLYFLIFGALKDLFYVYFYVNMIAYPKQISILMKLFETIRLGYQNLFGNFVFFLFIVLGLVILFFRRNLFQKKDAFYQLLFVVLMTIVFVYIGGTNYHYYSFILSPFLVLGFIALESFLSTMVISWIPCCICCFLSCFSLCPNTPMILWSKEDYAQYRFRNVISKVEHATILNYGFLDGGFYTTFGLIPEQYYFMKNNISYQTYPQMMDNQRSYVQNRLVDFVVLVKSHQYNSEIVEIERYYRLVDAYTQVYQGGDTMYLLYQLKEEYK